MNCTRFRDQYCDYADGDLDEVAEIAMIRHLHGCAACRRFEAALNAGCGVLKAIQPLKASDDFELRLQERLHRECGRPVRPGPGLRHLVAVAGAIMVVVTAGVVVLDQRSRDSGSGQFVQRAVRPAVPARSPWGRVAHDTTFNRDPFRVIPARSDPSFGVPARMDITVDWMVP